MSADEAKTPPPASEEGALPGSEPSSARATELDDAPDSLQMRALLKRSLVAPEEPSPRKESAILTGVQKKIRKRSRGKFYGDGWSTTQSRLGYSLVAMVMLVVLALCYFSMMPSGVSAP